jgi:uncharacterized protein (TIGR00304 family)
MNRYQFLSLICFIFSIVFFILGFLQGDIQTGIFVIFPFLSGTGIYAFSGFILFFIAILLFIFGYRNSDKSYELKIDKEDSQSTKKTSVKGGGVVLVGPIPIIFGSNWKIAVLLMILTIILLLVAFFCFRLI